MMLPRADAGKVENEVEKEAEETQLWTTRRHSQEKEPESSAQMTTLPGNTGRGLTVLLGVRTQQHPKMFNFPGEAAAHKETRAHWHPTPQ